MRRMLASSVAAVTAVDGGDVHHLRIVATVSALLLLVAGVLQVSAEAPAHDAFERTWMRTDKPVADDVVDRTWMWGPEAFTAGIDEDYADAPGGSRNVQYFDKSRMEVNSYRGSDPWDVTNGLLVVELITGEMQVGDDEFESHEAADMPVAGDPSSTAVPSYASLDALRDDPAHDLDSVITTTVDHDGSIGDMPDVLAYGVTAAHHVAETGHTVASPFWTFMTSSGPVYEDGEVVTDDLFLDPFYATGFPITEAHWTRAIVNGTETDVLVQAFQRRVLTYTPSNPDGWQVESGNVGRHYYEWRHESDATPKATPTETPTEEPTEEPTETVVVDPLCDPAYPDFCIPPPPPDLSCDDDILNGQQNFTVLAPDPHDFDTDGDGVGCESSATIGGTVEGTDIPIYGPFGSDPEWDGPVKVIDTNVPGALVCVYAAGGVEQDGKPATFDEEDCELLLVTDKPGGGGGQGGPDTFVANLGDSSIAAIEFTEDTNNLNVVVHLDDVIDGEEYRAVIAGFGGCDLNNDNDCDDPGENVGGENAVCSPDADATLPNDFSGDVIIDLGAGIADDNGDLVIEFEDILTAEENQQLGDLTDNVVVVTDESGTIVACGIVEGGAFAEETPEDATARLGAVIVAEADANGDVAFGLPAGHYVAVVTADGYSFATEAFTLSDGETEINEVNLVSD